jgi:hypothetical protein
MSTKQNLYIGRSGQMAVMAMFLLRGYNVAIPEIDIGEDIFVVRDRDGDLSRIQVKAAIGKGKKQVAGTFKVPMAQLRRPHVPELHYVFTVHHDGLWREFVIVRRNRLRAMHENEGIGNVVEENLLLYLSFTVADVRCGAVSLQQYRGDWSNWPLIRQ